MSAQASHILGKMRLRQVGHCLTHDSLKSTCQRVKSDQARQVAPTSRLLRLNLLHVHVCLRSPSILEELSSLNINKSSRTKYRKLWASLLSILLMDWSKGLSHLIRFYLTIKRPRRPPIPRPTTLIRYHRHCSPISSNNPTTHHLHPQTSTDLTIPCFSKALQISILI
jgi:hypothetical protein